MKSRLINRNVVALRGRTSIRLEPEIWDALNEICLREGIGTGDLVRRLEQQGHEGGRTSAVRVHVLNYFREAASEEGHRAAGHGTLDSQSNSQARPGASAPHGVSRGDGAGGPREAAAPLGLTPRD